jgi:hypothetical protein
MSDIWTSSINRLLRFRTVGLLTGKIFPLGEKYLSGSTYLVYIKGQSDPDKGGEWIRTICSGCVNAAPDTVIEPSKTLNLTFGGGFLLVEAVISKFGVALTRN